MPAITYRARLKEGNNIIYFTDKVKKLYKKLPIAKEKDKDSTKDNLNLSIIKLIISGT